MSLLERHEQILDNCVASLKTWKQLIVDYLDGEDRDAELNKLEQVTKDYCHITNNFQKSVKVLQKVEEQLNDDEGSPKDVDQLYKDNLENVPTPSGEDYMANEFWQNIFSGRSDVMEVKQKENKLDESQFEELGDSLLCSNVFTPPIDPISKKYSMIVDYIKQQKRKAKCPYIGCKSNHLAVTDLVIDAQLQSQITQYIDSQHDAETEDEDY
ncbi:hypothetical protein NQ314_007822 [Rhamnusium bicolor]|uniref:E3 SUMO-protein ligase NSE2 n=1 Tax=Rhamnusium bicolor TaxID=1586634 RepID=A0AAV8YJA0_9CUCU|nr:hypothetical protein NQ314_007822 [Rhamnusium bicolor]